MEAQPTITSILIIEDNDALRDTLATELTEYGYNVRQARDASQGMESFRAAPADLVLTDLVMPRMAGTPKGIKLRRNVPTLGIIAMSASPRASDYFKLAGLLGATRTLEKPFPLRALIAAIEDVRTEKTFPSKMLVIDEKPQVCSLVRKLARRNLGRPVVLQAVDVPMAVPIFERTRPDLVLLDFDPSGETGFATLARIREIDPEAVVVIMTSVTTPGIVERALTAGATGYLFKDAPQEDLTQALSEIVREVFDHRALASVAPESAVS